MDSTEAPDRIGDVLDILPSAEILDDRRFKEIVEAAPVAIAVAELKPSERIVYANAEFERITDLSRDEIQSVLWDRLPGRSAAGERLGDAVIRNRDYLGCFEIEKGQFDSVLVDAWSSVVEDQDTPVFRLVALVEVAERRPSVLEDLEKLVREKDTQLRELQHRVKNNLQMITALIRAEARGIPDGSTGQGFERLAGRIEALGVLYRALSESEHDGAVDLGVYLTQVASAVMTAHATEGVGLELRVDNWPVSIDIAMPLGLVVNELMTNALKHAFVGRQSGLITVHSTCGPEGCTVLVGDDGVGFPAGAPTWPKPGKLSSMIVRSLLDNARATFEVQTAPGDGTQVTFRFSPVRTSAP